MAKTFKFEGTVNATDIQKNGTSLATVATSGSYNDLSNKPEYTLTKTGSTIYLNKDGTAISNVHDSSGSGGDGNDMTEYTSQTTSSSEYPVLFKSSTSTTTTAGKPYFDAADLTFQPSTGTLTSTIFKSDKIYAPTTSNGNAYGVGSAGQVLKSNGTSVYWGTDNSGSGGDGNYYHTPTSTSGIKIGTGNGVSDLYVPTGTASGTVCVGNDSRLSDSRTPKSHATSSTTYGAGTTTNYGHVKTQSGDITGTSSTDGIAAGLGHYHTVTDFISDNASGQIEILARNSSNKPAYIKSTEMFYDGNSSSLQVKNGIHTGSLIVTDKNYFNYEVIRLEHDYKDGEKCFLSARETLDINSAGGIYLTSGAGFYIELNSDSCLNLSSKDDTALSSKKDISLSSENGGITLKSVTRPNITDAGDICALGNVEAILEYAIDPEQSISDIDVELNSKAISMILIRVEESSNTECGILPITLPDINIINSTLLSGTYKTLKIMIGSNYGQYPEYSYGDVTIRNIRIKKLSNGSPILYFDAATGDSSAFITVYQF